MKKVEEKKAGAIRNLGGGQPTIEEFKGYRYLIARDAAEALGKNEGNFSKEIKDEKVASKEMQLYVQDSVTKAFFPLGTKTIRVVDMVQFVDITPIEEAAPKTEAVMDKKRKNKK